LGSELERGAGGGGVGVVPGLFGLGLGGVGGGDGAGGTLLAWHCRGLRARAKVRLGHSVRRAGFERGLRTSYRE
jgi:hypothetical protein